MGVIYPTLSRCAIFSLDEIPLFGIFGPMLTCNAIEKFKNCQGSLWASKLDKIFFEQNAMSISLGVWKDVVSVWKDSSYSDARSRLVKEMDYRVGDILLQNFNLHTLDDQANIAIILAEHSHPKATQAISQLPGGKDFFMADPDLLLEEKVRFRTHTLENLFTATVSYEAFENYRKKFCIGISKTLRALGALACSQKGSRGDIVIYFDNEEAAVYAMCLI